MKRSILVVGAGLTGLFAAIEAARRGSAVRLIAEGRGGLSLSHGCIDIWSHGNLRFSLPHLDRQHPLRLIGWETLEESVLSFLSLVNEAELAYAGGLGQDLRLPTALGAIHTTAAAPVSLAAGSLGSNHPAHVAGILGLRDFSAPLIASGMRSQGVEIRGTMDLPLPGEPASRDLYAHEIGARLDDGNYRSELAALWRPNLRGVRRLGLPAVLGLDRALEVFASLEERLGVELFEIPTLPPSLPGLRLERRLRRAALSAGVDLIEGPSVRGEIDGRSAGRRVSGGLAATAGGPRAFRSEAVLLATGGALHGGWLSFPNGEVQEAVFGLPIDTKEPREEWMAATPSQEQPYARFGLRVDGQFRPCDGRGRPYFENLYAAGGVLGGADRSFEGSRQGIGLASALAAVKAALS